MATCSFYQKYTNFVELGHIIAKLKMVILDLSGQLLWDIPHQNIEKRIANLQMKRIALLELF